jgi:MinD-like ATPase involved in chromosome partitioning or flagellar assembly
VGATTTAVALAAALTGSGSAGRCRWAVTEAAPGPAAGTARDDPDAAVTADELVLVTTVGVAGATAAEETLRDLRARGAGAADRCVLVLTGVPDAGRPVARGDVLAYFGEHCRAVLVVPRARSRRGVRALAAALAAAAPDGG